MAPLEVVEALLGGKQAWALSFYLKSFDMDSVHVGKAVFGKEIFTSSLRRIESDHLTKPERPLEFLAGRQWVHWVHNYRLDPDPDQSA